jgi:hypothetical protein
MNPDINIFVIAMTSRLGSKSHLWPTRTLCEVIKSVEKYGRVDVTDKENSFEVSFNWFSFDFRARTA